MRATNSARMNIGALVVFHAIRCLERTFPVDSFLRVIATGAWVRGVLKRSQRLEPVPACLGARKQSPSWRERRRSEYLHRTLQYFPDRLATEKWRGRVQLLGGENLELARKENRPVVLAFCHFGPYVLLRYWLRALGISATTLVRGESSARPIAKRLQDRVSPFHEIPTALYNEDQLREFVRVLASGNPVLVAIDVAIGKQMDVPVDDHWTFRMATGAIRLAIRNRADLIPCLIADQGAWRFEIMLGRPVPAELLRSEDIASIGKHLVEAMLPQFQKHPEQCSSRLLSLFHMTDSANHAPNELSHSGRLVAG